MDFRLLHLIAIVIDACDRPPGRGPGHPDLILETYSVRAKRGGELTSPNPKIWTGTIDRIMEMSDAELGLKALLGQLAHRF